MKILGNILYYGLVFPFLIHMIYRGLTYPFRGGERKLRKQLDAMQSDRRARIEFLKVMFNEDYGYFVGPAWYYKQDHSSFVSLETLEFLMFLYDITAHELCEIMSQRKFSMMDVEGIDATLGTTFAERNKDYPRNEERIYQCYSGVTDRSHRKAKTIGDLIKQHIEAHSEQAVFSIDE